MATQTQNIIDFYNTAQDKDFARQFQFRITKIANTNFDNTQLVYLETATLPGRSITNVQVPFMGLQFNVPGTATYPGSDAWNVSFRCDSNYDIRTVLENATFNTFDDATSEGTYSIPKNSSDVILKLLGKDPDVTVREYSLIGAYIVAVGESTYNLGDSGSIVTIPATIAYQYWRVTGTGNYSQPSVQIANNTPVTNRAK
jgi:hypothetical protein